MQRVLLVGGSEAATRRLADRLQPVRPSVRIEWQTVDATACRSDAVPLPDVAIVDWDVVGDADPAAIDRVAQVLAASPVVVVSSTKRLSSAIRDFPGAAAFLRSATDDAELAAVVLHALSVDEPLHEPSLPPPSPHRSSALDYVSALRVLIWSTSNRLREERVDARSLREATEQDLLEMAELTRALSLMIVR